MHCDADRYQSAGRLLRRAHIAAQTAAILLLVVSCGRYFTAEIAGYVRDSESDAGIDGAVIRIYLSEPDTADADGFIVETASVTSSGNAGYFNHRIIWQNALPEFGAEGDTSSVWLGISHEDYLAKVVQVRGILSDTVNFVPDVTLDRAEFSVPSITGRVVDPVGEGINGVRVVLDLPSTEDDEEDYVTVTTEIDEEDGRYEFTDVSWRDDEAAGSGSDTEEVTIFVDDNEYSSDDVLTVLLSSDQEIEVSEAINAASDEFSVPRVWGRVLDVAGEPINGIRVVLDLASTDGEDETEDYTATTGTVDGEEGIYEFTDVTWVDEAVLGSLSDTEDATLRVDDNDYETDTEISITLESDQEQEIGQDFSVTRSDATSFSASVTGRCIERSGAAPEIQETPKRGIEVTLTYLDEDENQQPESRTLYAYTDAAGEYSFNVQWTDTTPGAFEEGTVDALTEVPDEAIPAGEDGLIVEISFSAPFGALSFVGTKGTYEIPSPGASTADRLIKSWLAPNYVPDAVVDAS